MPKITEVSLAASLAPAENPTFYVEKAGTFRRVTLAQMEGCLNDGITAAPFSAATAYAAGDYVVYNGKLYCFTADHAAGAWTGSDASACRLADEMSLVKSQLEAAFTEVKSANLANINDLENGAISEDGSYNTASGYKRSKDFIKISPSTVYYSKYITYIAYYDAIQNFISRVGATSAGGTVTTPSNAYYVKLISQANPSVNPWRFNKGSSLIDVDYYSYMELNGDVNIDQVLDQTLTESGKAADAKATGDALNNLAETTESALNGISEVVDDALEKKTSPNLANINDLETGGIGEDGSYNTASNYKRSKNFISISPNTVYYSKYISNIAYYDSSQGFIIRVSATSSGGTVTTPANAYYCKLVSQANPTVYPWRFNKGSTLIDVDYYSYVELKDGVNIDNVMDSTLSENDKAAPAKTVGDILAKGRFTDISMSMFSSIGVIGDSFAAGYISNGSSGTDHNDLSWGKVLGRDAGATVDIYAQAGADTEGWLSSNTYGLGKLNNTAANQLYVIALGINDAARGATLGTIADIESNSTDSFYSRYGRIVRAIRSHAPNAIIMLSTNARFGGGYNTFSDAIKAIGNYYHFPVFDLSADAFFTSAFFANTQVSDHPIAVGYAGMAKAYRAMIEQALYDNASNYATFVG